MKKIFILLFAILIIGCSKSDRIAKKNGSKLVSISYQSESDTWTENYSYDSDKRVLQIEDFRSLGRKYEIEYENNRLKQYTTYQITNYKKVFRDSMLYNSAGQIKRIYHFSINAGINLPLSSMYEYEYDPSGKLSKRKSYIIRKEKYATTENCYRIEKYYWKDNNIAKVEECDENEILHYEFLYIYDNKRNYKKNIPVNISEPVSWSENNVIAMNWFDYYGNLDLECRPCESTYAYNLDSYPVIIETNTGRKMVLTYE